MKARVHTCYRKGFIALMLLWLFPSFLFGQALTGDYRSRVSGNWNVASTWDICTAGGTPGTWAPAGTIPSSANNVRILAGHTVTVPVTGPYNCKSLVVEATAKLYTNLTGTNVYIGIWGASFICDGEIGNGAAFDGISFNFEAVTTTISGSGIITASRFRKSVTTNVVTNLIIATNVTLRWDQASNTQMYNNATGTSKFNVTVNAGCTLNCTGSGTNPGNIAIDDIDGAGANSAAGTITVNGTVNVAGRIYLRTNNATAGDSCSWIVNNGGILRCGSAFVGTSGAAGNFLRIMSGGKLEITGSPGIESSPAFGVGSILPTANNAYLFYPGSFCEYSAAGMQYVPSIPNTVIAANAGPANNLGYYGNLKLTGSGNKELIQQTSTLYPFKVFNNVEISNATGSPVFNCNEWTIELGGNWINYNQSGFNEGSAGRVRFKDQGASLGVSTITCPGGEVFNLLTYWKSSFAAVRFNNNVTVTDRIEWSAGGSYDLNGNDLILKNRAASAFYSFASTKYLYSERTDNKSRVVWNIGTPVGDSIYTIPFGKSATGYVPFTFKVPAGVNADTMKVATYAVAAATNQPWPSNPDVVTNLNGINNPLPDNRDAVVDRFWQINSTAATPPSLDFTFTYLAAELPVTPYNDPTTMGAQNWSTASSLWRLPVLGTGSVAPTYTVTVTNTNYYGPWTLVSYNSPLPVELLSFTAKPSGKIVNLEWSTASEINNLRFEAERSLDGRNFYKIGTVAGAGTTSVQQHYALKDENPFPGISYYRLTQIDYDGTRTTSRVVAVNFRRETQGILYPQPASELVIWEPDDKTLSNELIFSIYSTSGTLVQQEKVQPHLSGGYPVPVSGLSNSIYFLVISGEGVQQQIPLLINR